MTSGTYVELGRGPIHPFPARMAPSIAFSALRDRGPPITVLDPMAGSGVVAATAGSVGHRAIAADLDPLAVLMTKVWCRPLDRESLEVQARATLAEARGRADAIPEDEAYPNGADAETAHFVDYWFDAQARRQLVALSQTIEGVAEEHVRDALWCAFSRLIITKQSGASLAMDLSHGRPHRTFEAAPRLPFAGFEQAAALVAANTLELSEAGTAPEADVRIGDARALWLSDGSVDLVLTSPPYLNAIDYIRCSKFSLVWMGHSISELRAIRSSSVGTEVGLYGSEASRLGEIVPELGPSSGLPKRQQAILAHYVQDLESVVAEVARVLVPAGHAVFVVGENTVRGVFIRNSRIVKLVARNAGLACVETRARELPPSRRYLPPPASAFGAGALAARMRREVVMTFEKPTRDGANPARHRRAAALAS